jgi:hypothetical protein
MLTIFYHPATTYSPGIEVILDMSLKDVDEVTDELTAMFKEASKAKRKVGCVIRQFGGTTYFTYDDATRAQLEISLIAALIVPKSDVHVSQDSGGSETWDKF